MRRYNLKEGDKATSGATVLEGIDSDTHHGVPLAFIGATLHCPACKSLGVLVGAGPRWPDTSMGKELALDGDMCVCKCDPPPRMIASQSDMYQDLESHDLESMGFTPSGMPLLYHHDEQITLRDRRTRRILPNVDYRVKDGSSVIASGKTDAKGRTERVRTDNKQNVVVEIFQA
jgi:uncharacterized Zn-binding protein involved in type VI secretion